MPDVTLNDIVDTLAEAVAGSVFYVLGGAVSSGAMLRGEAVETMRGYVRHMRSEKHKVPAIAGGIALKVEQLADMFEAAGTERN